LQLWKFKHLKTMINNKTISNSTSPHLCKHTNYKEAALYRKKSWC
jgi:hypothetical protein